jgi:hypothetical protein
MNQDGNYVIGSGMLALASWATTLQPVFSILASIAAIVLAIFGIINYLRKWKQTRP